MGDIEDNGAKRPQLSQGHGNEERLFRSLGSFRPRLSASLSLHPPRVPSPQSQREPSEIVFMPVFCLE